MFRRNFLSSLLSLPAFFLLGRALAKSTVPTPTSTDEPQDVFGRLQRLCDIASVSEPGLVPLRVYYDISKSDGPIPRGKVHEIESVDWYLPFVHIAWEATYSADKLDLEAFERRAEAISKYLSMPGFTYDETCKIFSGPKALAWERFLEDKWIHVINIQHRWRQTTAGVRVPDADFALASTEDIKDQRNKYRKHDPMDYSHVNESMFWWESRRRKRKLD